MANPIIQSYLNDTSIDPQKRKGLMEALNAGQADENKAAQTILQKYGNKYGQGAAPQQAPKNDLWNGVLDTVDTVLQGPGTQLMKKSVQQSPEFQYMNPDEQREAMNQFSPTRQIGNFANAVSESTIKPIGQFAGGALTTGYKDIQGFKDSSDLMSEQLKKRGKQDWGLLNIVNPDMWGLAMSPEGAQPMDQDAQNRLKQINQTSVAPVNVPWLGNLNMNRGDQNGNYDFLKSLVSEGAYGGDALLGYMNLTNPIKPKGWSSILEAGKRGGLQSGLKEMKYNENYTPESVADSAMWGGGLSAGTQALFQGLPWLKQKLHDMKGGASTMQGQAAGLTDETIDTLKNPNLGQQALDKLDDAKAAKINPIEFDDPMQQVGQQNLKPAVGDVIKQNKELGSQLDDIISGSKEKLTTGNAVDKLRNLIQDNGGRWDTKAKMWVFETLDDGTVPTITNGGDIKNINELWTNLNKFADKPIKPVAIWNTVKNIDDKINYTAKTMEPMGNEAQALFKQVRGVLSGDLKSTVTDSAPLFDQMSKNYDLIDFFNPKLGENASSATVLRNLFSPNQKDALKPNIQALEESTGRQIFDPTRSAKAAMDIAGDVNAKNLLQTSGGPKSMAMDAIRRFIFRPENAAKNIVNTSLPYTPAPYTPSVLGGRNIGIQALLNLLRGEQQPTQ